MGTQGNESGPKPSPAKPQLRTYLALLLAAVVAVTSTGCAAGATQPHITAKVIFQDESGVAAEIASEWR